MRIFVSKTVEGLSNPHVLIPAGGEFNRRTNAAFAGLPNFVKIIDDSDCLAHDTDLKTHLTHVRAVLTKPASTASPRVQRNVFRAQCMDFCGYQVSEDGQLGH